MIYLYQFKFPDIEKEYDDRFNLGLTCYDTMYPYFILSKHNLVRLDFEPITIFYGGNGSGKTTALNVISETLKLTRDTVFNKSSFFEQYTNRCSYATGNTTPKDSRIITSDDVFDFMLNVRNINEGIDKKRDELFEEFCNLRYNHFQLRSLDDYEQLKNVCEAKKKKPSMSKYVRKKIASNIREYSNGESGYIYFTEKIRENGLYLLDEPENSLSPQKQQELVSFLEESARFFNCQLIIATHSPFILSMRGAKIYDFDENPVDVKRWVDLKNVRAYYDFFKKHEREFVEL